MKKQAIEIISLGCRLNLLEAEKIRVMLAAAGTRTPAVIINTCAVTKESFQQSQQMVQKAMRKYPDAAIFVTGCGATLSPDDFPGAVVISNTDKLKPSAYGIKSTGCNYEIRSFEKMQKRGFVAISDGCNRTCTYCITRILRGPAIHYEYGSILKSARALVDNGYEEIFLVGINIADYQEEGRGLVDLCRRLLKDLPEIKQLTMTSIDAAADVIGIIDLMALEPRMTKHIHLSVQSGCDWVLSKMGRRHTVDRVREIMNYGNARGIEFSWDIIVGFPGETEEFFDETLRLVRELKPMQVHSFLFSVRSGTKAAEMPDKVSRAVAKKRLKRLDDITKELVR